MKFLVLTAMFAQALVAQHAQVQLDNAHTRVGWTLTDVLHTVHGTFRITTSDLWFEASSGRAGGQIVVDARSGESGSSARDSRMKKNVLQSDRFPDITFVPDRVEGNVNLQGDSDLQLHGLFTIHGASHAVLMPVKTHIDHGKLQAVITFSVPYVKWGMKSPSTLFLKVNDSVEIEIKAEGAIVN
jgi:polyisoprenoid-binding protein YceI